MLKNKGRNVDYSNYSKNKESNKSINIESKINKEKIINNELVKQQYKIIKDFLIPILKEQNAKELVSCYNKMTKNKKKLISKNKTTSLRNKPILEYSFISDSTKNKLKIPLFQIMFPNQYKNHMAKKNKERNLTINRPCRNISFRNMNSNISDSKGIKSMNNKSITNEIRKRNSNNLSNNKYNNNQTNLNLKTSTNYNIKSSLLLSTTKNRNKYKKSLKNIRSKTPPLYLRLKEVTQKHNEEMELLRKKYEYNFDKKAPKIESEETSSDFSDTSSSVKSRNKSKIKKNDFEKWYGYEKTWMKMKDIKVSIIKTELEEDKMHINLYNKQQETFKPKINKKSEMLVKNNFDNNFYIRLKNYQMNKEKKEKMLKEKLKPKFKPYINTNYNINKEYYLYMNYDQRKINKDLKLFLEKN